MARPAGRAGSGGDRWGDGPGTLPPPQPPHSRPEQRVRSSRPVPLGPKQPAAPFPAERRPSNILTSFLPEGMSSGQNLSGTSHPHPLETVLFSPSLARLTKSEAPFLDRETEAQSGQRAGPRRPQLRKTRRSVWSRGLGETLPLGQSASSSKADSALTWGPWCSLLLSPLTA